MTGSEQFVSAASELARKAERLAPQSERDRRLAGELVAELASAGFFRLCVPRGAGGFEASPATLLEVVEVLSRGDAAAGWCVAVCATSGLLAGYLPESAAREVYAAPETIAGGAFAPRGRARRVEGGFRVSGRWQFASGCEHCAWLMGGCLIDEDGETQLLASGRPEIRLMLAPSEQVQIHDTWHVSGLRGTGSHDIEFVDVFVPAERSASLFTDAPVAPGPLYTFPLFGLLALAIAGVGLGIGRGALDDVGELAAGKRPTGSQRVLAERPTAQVDMARGEAALRAARSLLYEVVKRAWAGACERGEVSLQERVAIRLASTHAVECAAGVVQIAYRLGGGSSVYETSTLQRRLRDVNAVTQHMAVAPATWELTGRVLLGLPTEVEQL